MLSQGKAILEDALVEDDHLVAYRLYLL